MEVSGQNAFEPPVEVLHSSLQRHGDSAIESVCPRCLTGVLRVLIHPQSRDYMEHDRCTHCGQIFRYTDIEQLRKL